MDNLGRVIAELKAENKRLNNEQKQVQKAIVVLHSVNRNASGSAGTIGGSPGRTMSAAARRKISQAKKAWWAKRRLSGQKGTATPVKRTLSLAGRRRIAAAQRARWAGVRQQKKAA